MKEKHAVDSTGWLIALIIYGCVIIMNVLMPLYHPVLQAEWAGGTQTYRGSYAMIGFLFALTWNSIMFCLMLILYFDEAKHEKKPRLTNETATLH